jgi:hypothetical protein
MGIEGERAYTNKRIQTMILVQARIVFQELEKCFVGHSETRQKGWLDVFVSCSLPGDKGYEGRTDAET